MTNLMYLCLISIGNRILVDLEPGFESNVDFRNVYGLILGMGVVMI